MTERQYSDDEVAAIFRAAAEGAESRAMQIGSPTGLTLRDLQAIAREVDIPADAVARAAQALDSSRTPTTSAASPGFPFRVQRVAALGRRLTDEEWELLVVDLRQTFNARGTVRSHGTLREWSNGNLHVFLEPTPTGYQLRLTTFKGNVRVLAVVAAIALATSVFTASMVASGVNVAVAVPATAILATVGAALTVNRVFRLPAWARLRGEQMDGIIDRVTTPRDSPT